MSATPIGTSHVSGTSESRRVHLGGEAWWPDDVARVEAAAAAHRPQLAVGAADARSLS